MPDLTLSDREQLALRRLLAAEPVPGSALPAAEVFETISELVRCDAMGAVLVDGHNRLVEEVLLPHGHIDPDEDLDGEPLYLGVMHWSRSPEAAEACGALGGMVDGVAVGYRNGCDHVAQLFLDRKRVTFSERDLAMVRMLVPVFGRLVRERPTPSLPGSLTVQERRVLMHVAGGRSNAEIAASLFIAPSTVRKHLENTYRKLGVTNRVAAVARLQGRDLPDLDLRARIERYA